MINIFGRTKSKITKDKNRENVPHLEITEAGLVHCNIVNKIAMHLKIWNVIKKTAERTAGNKIVDKMTTIQKALQQNNSETTTIEHDNQIPKERRKIKNYR